MPISYEETPGKDFTVQRKGRTHWILKQHRIKKRRIKNLVLKRLVDMTGGQSSVRVPMSPAV